MRLALIMMLTALNSALLRAQAEFIKPNELSPANGYSHVVVTSPGRLAFISGQVANDLKGNLVGKGDLKLQADQVFRNLTAALAAAGASFKDVVKITWYVKDYKPESLAVLREVRNRYVNTAAPPASTLVGVASLFQPDYLLEVEAVATIPMKQAKK